MKIDQIKFYNFRIYKGETIVDLRSNSPKNINIIAGRNGYGKTTFLTALIWAFYGKMMVEVDNNYKDTIRKIGGYNKFLKTLINKDVGVLFDSGKLDSASFSVEILITDIDSPILQCQKILIKREYDMSSKKETLTILIDDIQNELVNELGLELFINDFILPREIAKFFFFDSEKIVSLAEFESKDQLGDLNRAYSEVLGIKKFEDLKNNLEKLLTKLSRNNITDRHKNNFDKLIQERIELNEIFNHYKVKVKNIDQDIIDSKLLGEQLQERLIREGDIISINELYQLKENKRDLERHLDTIKSELKENLEFLPLAFVVDKIKNLIELVENESMQSIKSVIQKESERLILEYTEELHKKLSSLDISKNISRQITDIINNISDGYKFEKIIESNKTRNLLNYNTDQLMKLKSVYDYVVTNYSKKIKYLTDQEKKVKYKLSQINQKVKQSETKKNNPLIAQLQTEKKDVDKKTEILNLKRDEILSNIAEIKIKIETNNRLISQMEKEVLFSKNNYLKYNETINILDRVNQVIESIKRQKKSHLEESLKNYLKLVMHKVDMIGSVCVKIENNTFDIDLYDSKNKIIEKSSLSKGEQQLYATSLLMSLVEVSCIRFPVFIDSPLQKFDKTHAKNIITNFYPKVSEQVVIFPLLDKELSIEEFQEMLPVINTTHIIQNKNNASTIVEYSSEKLFEIFNNDSHVYTN